MSNCECCKECKDKMNEIVEKYKKIDGGIIGALHEVQDTFGYISEENQEILSRGLGVPMSDIYGIITFYNRFSLTPKGECNVQICMGTACYVKGSQIVLDRFKEKLKIQEGQVSEDGKFSIETVRCIGACGLAPAIVVNGEVYGKVDKEKVDEIIEKYRNNA